MSRGAIPRRPFAVADADRFWGSTDTKPVALAGSDVGANPFALTVTDSGANPCTDWIAIAAANLRADAVTVDTPHVSAHGTAEQV